MWRHNPGSAPPPPAFRSPTLSRWRGGELKDGEHIVVLYAYRLRGGGGDWKLETVVLGRQGVDEGQLVQG